MRLALSLPTVHCQNCIVGVERILESHPGVKTARVNLTLKRVLVDADTGVMAHNLVPVLEAAGFEAHELDLSALDMTDTDPVSRDLLMRLAVAGFATMNVMLLSISIWSGAEAATRDLFHWISAAITMPAIAFSAQPFFKNAWGALRVRRLNMDVPIVLAILLALLSSLWETILSGPHAYFDAAIALTFFLLVGRYLDQRTRSAARSAAKELTALEVSWATRLDGGKETIVSLDKLRPGDRVSVKPGERIPVDGTIVDGQSEIDQSFLTGETLPAFADIGATVSAGEVNLTGPLTIRATAVGHDTSLHQMAELVAIAETGRKNYSSLADRAAKLYAPGVHVLSALSFAGWLAFTWDIRTSLNIAAAVLIITCPCALGLAVPAVTTAASGKLFRRGMLIKSATALERLAAVDTIVFDKTGTLTSGTPELINLNDHARCDQEIACALARASAHPLSKALVHAAQEAGVKPVALSSVSETPGWGIEGYWNGSRVQLGRAEWFGVKPFASTHCWLKIEEKDAGVFLFSDKPRIGSKDMITALQSAKKDVFLYSGDSPTTVQSLADQMGIKKWKAEALPEDKVNWVHELQQDGRRVLMVGDGLNDTAALAAADVSISPASALDAARVASDIVLLGSDLTSIPDALNVAQKSVRRIRENFQIATVYNIIAVPLAVAGLATPLIAALAMSASSVSVSLNALRLK
ncbi:MAG: heavy metal translocating P-type ATPase [Aestuariivita sp.]|nr:heavy metal translocating P-type ATPase [Aestuariivita sp.]